MTELNETATELVLRPVDGDVTTVNGHRIPQPPSIVQDDPNTVIAYGQWLIDQDRREAQELGDD
jgi:glycine cleavage system H lipoate-binding protein